MDSQTVIKYMSKLKNWQSYCDTVEPLTAKEKGELFEVVTYYAFKLIPILNVDVEEIYMLKDIPQKIIELLGIPINDKGIDMIAKIKGKYYAIQSKYRHDPYRCIKWGELGTFLDYHLE